MSDAYIGEIRLVAFNYAPVNWCFCDGSLLSISEYNALYSLLGTQYGGDGVNNFGIPDLRGRIPVSMGKSARSGTTYALGQKGGYIGAAITPFTMPGHTHPAAFTPGPSYPLQVSIGVSTTAAGQASPVGNVLAESAQSTGALVNSYAAVASATQGASLGGVSASAAGGTVGIQFNGTQSSALIDVMPPYKVLNYIMAVQGAYPPTS